MDWVRVLNIQILIWLIVLYDWSKLKKRGSRGDKITFITLLLLATVVSFFDLSNIPGPVTLLGRIFKPFNEYMG